jgi:hypothetical protein
MAPNPFRSKFRLKAATLAIATENGENRMVRLEDGEEITVLNRLDESRELNRQVDIEWNGKRLKMFAIDVLDRGERVGR